jgi:aminopeptidase N
MNTHFMKSCFLLVFILFYVESFAQFNPLFDQTSKVDFKNVVAEISILPKEREVKGKVHFQFEILAATDSIYLDAKNMQFEKVLLNNSRVEFYNDSTRLWLITDFKPSQKNTLDLTYSVKPKQTMYFINWGFSEILDVTKQVWTQGQGKYTSYWLPSFDDMKEKAVFDLKVNFNSGYEVISNGELKGKIALNDSITQWQYGMLKPMSSYLVAVAAGKFQQKSVESTSGIPISLYYLPEDKEKVEPTYRYSKEIFDFYETEIGYPYPWQNYKQIPVQDFLYSGMENTGTTIFANSLMVDSIAFNDRNYVNVNAHELAHQWFGNLITETNGQNHWLHEGFSTYYAMLAEKELFGDEYYYWKLYESAEELKELSDKGKGESLLASNSSSLTYYQKGAWALHILREKVGDEAFELAIKNYLEKYAFKNVTTENFIDEVEKTSGQDLSGFVNDWLKQSAFQGNEALNSLKKSVFITKYLEVAALRQIPFQDKKVLLNRALEFPVNDYIGQEAVFQLEGENSPSALKLYKKAFESGNLYVRQAIATSMDKIPMELKEEFIGLLEDRSYLTVEKSLLKLWMQFPEETGKWLEKTANIEGFSNKNVRMLWLTINLVSPEIDPEKTSEYYKELSGYTREYYPFEVRQNAFGYLYQLNAFSQQNLIDLLQAARHHSYHFRDFSRKLLDRLLENEEYHEKYVALLKHVSGEDREFLNKKLNK